MGYTTDTTQTGTHRRDHVPVVDKKLRIDETLWRTARAAAALEGKTVSDWISEKLRAELASVLPPDPSSSQATDDEEGADGPDRD
jgi:hypothetical protein